MFCNKCSTKLEVNAKFCGDCGEEYKPLQISQPRVNNKHMGVIVCAAIAILGVIGIVFLLSGTGFQAWICSSCGISFRGNAYYGWTMDRNRVMCEICALRFWAPHSIQQFRVR